MTVTTTKLTGAAGLAAVASGLIFIGVQVNHPDLDATSITSADMAVRDVLKVLMAALGLVGITGMYLHQVKRAGVLGLIGYLLLGSCYLLIMSTAFVALTVLPTIAGSNVAYVNDVLAAATNGRAAGDIGLLQPAILVQAFTYIVGGLLFGIALYRQRVLARWAAALLAASGAISIALSVMPDAFYRLLAFPDGIAMIGLGYSLWRHARTPTTQPTTVPASARHSRADAT